MRRVESVARQFRSRDGKSLSLSDDRPTLFFSFQSHGHVAEVDEVEGGRQVCAECHHRDIDTIPRVNRQFWHALHLPPDVLSGRLDDDEISRSCARCHSGIATSFTLAGSGLPYDADGCGQCHASETNGGASPQLSGDVFTTPATRIDFPHDRHASVQGGCLACHQLSADLGVRIRFE